MNLRDETLRALDRFGYMPDDVAWVGYHHDEDKWTYPKNLEPNRKMTFDVFLQAADRDYDNGYGGAEVNPSLMVAMEDGSWLERGEYDGAEWWEMKRIPTEPDEDISSKPLTDIQKAIFWCFGEDEDDG